MQAAITSREIVLSRIIKTFYIAQFMVSLGESIVSPIFPIEAQKRGISETSIGALMSLHAVSSVLTSTFYEKLFARYQKRSLMALGAFFQSMGYLIFALAYLIPYPQYICFAGITLVGRILSGMGSTFIIVPSYSLIPTLFSDSQTQKASNFEISVGLGLTLGYFVASIFFQLGGYLLPYFINSVFCLAIFLIILRFIPRESSLQLLIDDEMKPLEANKNNTGVVEKSESTLSEDLESNRPTEAQSEESATPNKTEGQLNILSALKNYRVFLHFAVQITVTTALMFLGPSQAIFLNDTLKLAESEIGLIFSLNTISYMLFCFLVGNMLKNKNLNKNCLINFGILTFAAIFLFYGPAPFLQIQNSAQLVIILKLVNGLGSALVFPTSMPALYSILSESFPEIKQQKLSDLAASINSQAWNIGDLFGFLLGGFLTEVLGFQQATTLLSMVLLAFSFLYFKQNLKSLLAITTPDNRVKI